MSLVSTKGAHIAQSCQKVHDTLTSLIGHMSLGRIRSRLMFLGTARW